MCTIGIDISKEKFDVCCLYDSNKKSKIFKNNLEGFSELLAWTNRLGVENPHFCMEATGCYHEALAEFLYISEHKVSVVNPLQTKKFRESKLLRQKTDKSDAFAISEFCIQNSPTLWAPKPPEIKELSDVNKHLDNLKEELRRWQNRLEKEHCNDLVKEDILSKIQELKALIKKFEGEAQRIIKSSQNLSKTYNSLMGITGVGPQLAITILSEMPDVKNFKNAGQYAAFAGVAPSHFQSGSSVCGKSHISRIGNSLVRKKIFMSALVVKNHNKHFQKWVKKLEDKGKKPKVIIVAIMRKLLSIIFGMLKNNSDFDPKLAFDSVGND
jgi:transposase